jgi:hypothetical protein
LITAGEGPAKTADKKSGNFKVRKKDQVKIGDKLRTGEAARTGAKHLSATAQIQTGTPAELSGVMRLEKLMIGECLESRTAFGIVFLNGSDIQTISYLNIFL